MLRKITEELLKQISNPLLSKNAQMYINIENNYLAQVEEFGLEIERVNKSVNKPEITLTNSSDSTLKTLIEEGLVVGNDTKSLHFNWISPACVSCRKGLDSLTFTISMHCPRDCFFCFNPNQGNYEHLQEQANNPAKELIELFKQNRCLRDIALTGGEPLLHKDETEEFFRTASQYFPDAYTRLYTSGAFLDEPFLEKLAAAGLDEIRFSIKTDDAPDAIQEVLDLIALSRKHIEFVMVEMPVLPDELELMKDLLLSLDTIGISGINLLELCFPFNNAQEFRRRGYTLKSEPFRVLYNYWYAGGLPVAGSEQACIELLKYTSENKLSMGVHYCSLENKLSGQVYQQNLSAYQDYPYCHFSQRDYFLKSAKVYGNDALLVNIALLEKGYEALRYDKDAQVLEFLPDYLASLADAFPNLEVAISYHILEQDDQGIALRELRLDLTTPATFNISEDL